MSATLRVVLDEQSIKHGLEFLVRRDEDLAGIVKNFGPPPFWQREPGFPTLVYLILASSPTLLKTRRSRAQAHRLQPPESGLLPFARAIHLRAAFESGSHRRARRGRRARGSD